MSLTEKKIAVSYLLEELSDLADNIASDLNEGDMILKRVEVYPVIENDDGLEVISYDYDCTFSSMKETYDLAKKLNRNHKFDRPNKKGN